MSRYKETTLTGESYVRANQITVQNPLNQNPFIIFTEEQVINLPDGEEIKRPISNVSETLNLYDGESNINESIQLVNPITFEEIQGATMTYEQIMTALFSLYYHVSAKRDLVITEQENDNDPIPE